MAPQPTREFSDRSPIVGALAFLLRSRMGACKAAGVALLLGLAGCSLSGVSPMTSSSVSPSESIPNFEVGDLPAVPVEVEDRLPPLIEHRDLTRDDPPTFAEYEETVFATVACIEAMGLAVWGPGLGSDPDIPFGNVVPGVPKSEVYAWAVGDPTEASLMTTNQAQDFCTRRYRFDEIQYLFHLRSEAEVRAWWQQLRTCMEANGIPGASDAPDNRLIGLPGWIECLP